jgi:hypothetical protein
MSFGSSLKDSNPQPFAPLGSAPAPRAPRVLPPLSAPLPLTPAPPGLLRSGSVAGTGDVATRRGTAAAACRSSCEPPSDQPQEACLPPHERRRCLCGGVSSHRACATAVQHARPHEVRLPAHRVSRSASCRAACVCFNGRENRGRGALSPPLERPPTRDCHDFASMSTEYGTPRGESDRRRSKGRSSPFGGGGLDACV